MILCALVLWNAYPSLSQLIFDEEPGKFTLDDGYQQSLSFYSSQREVLAATYYRYLLKNIGKQSKLLLLFMFLPGQVGLKSSRTKGRSFIMK